MNNKTIKTVLFIFGTTLFFSNNAFAQEQKREERKPPAFSELLEKMDSNEDGKLSEKEVKGPLKKHFAKIDTDEDGFITEEEMKKAPKPKRGPQQ